MSAIADLLAREMSAAEDSWLRALRIHATDDELRQWVAEDGRLHPEDRARLAEAMERAGILHEVRR
jgi:hypothetical protein